MGSIIGSERMKCDCGELSTTKITLFGKPFPSELADKETDFDKLMEIVMETMRPGLKGLRRHTGYERWDGRLVDSETFRYWAIMCDSCADSVLEKVPEGRWRIGVQKRDYCWGGLP